ncbi:MAG TPA: CBS domain-containing protein [Proteobacteria bacterium]|nr:CBS domain-containing protein [Pseudomonadota bacterium]
MRRDLIKRLGNIAVADIMTTDVITIAPDATMEELVRLFKESDVEGIPVVVKEKYLVGMAYLRDLLQLYFIPKYSLSDPDRLYALMSVLAPNRPVRDFMDSEPVIVGPNASASHLAYLMMHNGVYRVPVVKKASVKVKGVAVKGELVGIVSISDMVPPIFEAVLGEG